MMTSFDLSPYRDSKGALRVLLVYKNSRLQVYHQRRLARRLSRLKDAEHSKVAELELAHENHLKAIKHVEAVLKENNIQVQVAKRSELDKRKTKNRFMMTVGGDGTVLDVSHYVTQNPILGVNSSPVSSVGMLCYTAADDFAACLKSLLTGEIRPTPVCRAQLYLNGKELPIWPLNDILVAHSHPAMTTRYILQYKHQVEEHKNSGVWISTPIGSSSAMLSSGGQLLDIGANKLQVKVREPYFSALDQASLLHFYVNADEEVTLMSTMSGGKIFIDGANRHLPFIYGDRLTVTPRGPKLNLFVSADIPKRREQSQQFQFKKQQEGLIRC